MKNIIQDYVAHLNGNTYEVKNRVVRHHCDILSLSAGSHPYILKLFSPESCEKSRLTAWKNAYRRKNEILGRRDPDSNVCIPYTFGFVDDVDFAGRTTFGVLMECIPGPTLQCCLREQGFRLPPRMLSDVVDSLEYGNARNFFHMDVTEENLILYGGRLWLIDFTGAFIADCRAEVYTDCRSPYLPEGTVIATASDCVKAQAQMLLGLLSRSGCDQRSLDSVRSAVHGSRNPLHTLDTLLDSLN